MDKRALEGQKKSVGQDHPMAPLAAYNVACALEITTGTKYRGTSLGPKASNGKVLVIERLAVSSDTQRAVPQRSRQQDLHYKDLRQYKGRNCL